MDENFQYLERSRLDKRLESMKRVPLTLVTAPMGYGKSSIVGKYLQKNHMENLWITLGQAAVQEQWLWNHIAQEISKISEPVSQFMFRTGLPYGSDWELMESKFLTLLREDMSTQDFYLVLDDYQSCQGNRLSQFLATLAFEDIEGIHIIVISRQMLNLPLEELRLRGYCVHIKQTDLIMAPDELKQLFEINGICLDEQTFQEVCAYTDGWVAAARLIWHDYQETGNLQFYGSVQHLLKESLYRKLSPEEKHLLYPFTCFAELSCEELSVVADLNVTEDTLMRLTHKLVFFHYNSQNQKYMIHTLLHNVIVEEERDNREEIFYRYACYQEKNKQFITALEYYDKAGRREEIFQILDGEYRFEIMEQIPDFILTFFQKCDNNEEFIQHPSATLSSIYCMLLSAKKEILLKGRRFYTHVKHFYESQLSASDENRNLLGELYFLESLYISSNLSAASVTLRHVWELRGGKASLIFAKRPYTYGVPNTLFMYHNAPGMLKTEITTEIEYSREYMKLVYNTKASLDRFICGEYALEIGDIALAFTHATEALEKAYFQNQICIIISSYFVLFRAIIFQGRKEDFAEIMEKCEEFFQCNTPHPSHISVEYDLMCGYVYGVLGQLEKIPLWLRKRQFDNCNIIIRDSRNACIIYGFYLCRKKRWTKLAANAEEMVLSFTGTRHVFSEIYAHIFYSIAHWYTDKHAKALDYLLGALALAKPDHIMMPFAELSDELMPILTIAVEKEPFSREILSFCQQWQRGIKAFKSEEYREAIFSPREKEVLEFLVQGYRNSEIAERMHIAQITVEKNLTNIYRKIGVANRTSAVNWYNNKKI